MSAIYADMTDAQRQRFDLLVLLAGIIHSGKGANTGETDVKHSVEAAEKVIAAARVRVMQAEEP